MKARFDLLQRRDPPWRALCCGLCTTLVTAAVAAGAPAPTPVAAGAPAGTAVRSGAPAAIQGEAPHTPRGIPGAPSQAVSGDAVHIEGKLYSPQALIIVSRTVEDFGRDAVLPHYLRLEPAAPPLSYRLRADILQAAVMTPPAPPTHSASRD